MFLELQEPGRGGRLVPLTVNFKVSLDDLLDVLPEDVRFHTITQGIPYRLWNPVSNGFIQPNNDDPPVVTCSGQFGDTNSKEINYKTLFLINLLALSRAEYIHISC